MARQSRDDEVAIVLLDRPGPDVGQIDEHRRLRQAQHHHRHEALAAGDHAGVVAVLREQTDRLGPRRRAPVLKRRRVHPCLRPPLPCPAVNKRLGAESIWDFSHCGSLNLQVGDDATRCLAGPRVRAA